MARPVHRSGSPDDGPGTLRSMSTDLVLVNAGRLLDSAIGAAAAGMSLLVRDGRIEADLGPGDPRPPGGTTRTIDLDA